MVEELSLFDPGPSQSIRLTDRFGVPPFTILDTRQSYWQQRRREWLALGIQSELGRNDRLAYKIGDNNTYAAESQGQQADEEAGTSVFDPVLCEMVYRWFTSEGARVLDPFAGGSVRGITASMLGRWYVGMELREEQVEANITQGDQMCDSHAPTWVVGDAADVEQSATGEYDLVFTCPPYADLEVYSDDPRDLSTMPYDDFLTSYRAIIRASVSLLRRDRFAAIVVGDVRDKNGKYRNLVSETIKAFLDAGMHLYNEAILVNSVGTGALRAPKQFNASRKLVKQHQNVLVFVKGDAKAATRAAGLLEAA